MSILISSNRLKEVATAQLDCVGGKSGTRQDLAGRLQKAILIEIGWNPEKSRCFNPAQLYMNSRVEKAAAAALEAKKMTLSRQFVGELEGGGNFRQFLSRPECGIFSRIFSEEELTVMGRVPKIFKRALDKYSSEGWSQLFTVVQKMSVADNSYELAKEKLIREYKLQDIDLDLVVYAQIYGPGVPPGNYKKILAQTDRSKCCRALNVPIIREYFKYAFVDRQALTDDQIDAYMNPAKARLLLNDQDFLHKVFRLNSPLIHEYVQSNDKLSKEIIEVLKSTHDVFKALEVVFKKNPELFQCLFPKLKLSSEISRQLDLLFLRDLRWPITSKVFQSSTFYSFFFHLMEKDARLNQVPRNVNDVIQFLENNYPHLLKEINQSREKFKTNLQQELSSGRGLLEAILNSLPVDPPKRGAIRISMKYHNMMNEIRGATGAAPTELFTTKQRMDFIRMRMPLFYQHIQRVKPLSDEQFDLLLMRMNQGIHSAHAIADASLLLLSKIMELDTALSPIFNPFAPEEKASFLQMTKGEITPNRRFLQFAGLIEGSDVLDHPYIDLILTHNEKELIKNKDDVLKIAAKFFRTELTRVIQSNDLRPSTEIHSTFQAIAGQQQGNHLGNGEIVSFQFFRDATREPSKYIVSEKRVEKFSPPHAHELLGALKGLYQSQTSSTPDDSHLIAELTTQTGGNLAIEILEKRLEQEGIYFNRIMHRHSPLFITVKNLDPTHLQSTTYFEYTLYDQFNGDEKDTHYFAVTYDLIKQADGTRKFIFGGWHPLAEKPKPPKVGVIAEQLEEQHPDHSVVASVIHD